jgi:hypothetical protein
MKLKLFILFLLVFAAIGQTIFLNIDAKSIFLNEKAKSSHTHLVESDLDKSPVQSSEVVVTIRQHESEITNQDVSSETAETIISSPSSSKKPCSQETKEERLICQKAKEAAKQKQTRISGSNHLKSSTIQTPTP